MTNHSNNNMEQKIPQKKIILTGNTIVDAVFQSLELSEKKSKILKTLGLKKEEYFYIANLEIKCGTGTYVRGIANSLGEKIKIPALAYSIKRTKIGKYVI